jgi:hypothetical protein
VEIELKDTPTLPSPGPSSWHVDSTTGYYSWGQQILRLSMCHSRLCSLLFLRGATHTVCWKRGFGQQLEEIENSS